MLETTLQTLVTYNPQGVNLDTPIEELENIMRQIAVRHLPVIDDCDCVIGMVSERDIASARYSAVMAASQIPPRPIRPLSVDQIMTRQVLTVEQHESPDIALRAMVAHAFHSVPVTDAGRLAGMITSTDFLREMSYGNWAGHNELVASRMSPTGETVESEVILPRVMEVAERYNQEFVVVVRRNRPLGILSRTALRQALCCGRTPRELAELQSTSVRLALPHLPLIPAETTLARAASMMLEHRARALPVVDRSRVLIGMLLEDEILKTMVERLDPR
ncbi:MAG TPA: CBS domain-containing protein [Pirellulales bacterium]|jgi:CBS domain-containing protein